MSHCISTWFSESRIIGKSRVGMLHQPILSQTLFFWVVFVSLGLLAGCSEEEQSKVASADMERLLIVGEPGDLAMRSTIEARFRKVQNAQMQSMEAGRDVLLLDARQESPLSITELNHPFRQAYDAGVPILIMHMDDQFERAIHRILPSMMDVGYTGLALVIPPRAGHGRQDGIILHTARHEIHHEPWSASSGAINHALNYLKNSLLSRDKTQTSGSNGDSCSSVDPSLCTLVKKTPLARISLINDSAADGKCLTRDWDYVSAYATRPILALSHDASSHVQAPQCPSQIINFYPVLYLNETVNGPKSRVVSLGMDANLNPGSLSQRDSNAVFWYQTYFDMQVLPGVWSGPDLFLTGIQWLANLPHSANNQHSMTDSTGWSLNVSAKGNGEVSGGGSVSFSHSVTNSLSDWKYIDRTTQSSSDGAPWVFTAMQGFPYAGDSREECDGYGDVFNWSGVKCHAYPQSVRFDTIPDLSRSTAIINGVGVWDLNEGNNANKTATFSVTTTTRFDAVGCGRWANSNYWSPPTSGIAPISDVGDYDCGSIAFLNFGNGAAWMRRTQVASKKQFEIDLSLLPIVD